MDSTNAAPAAYEYTGLMVESWDLLRGDTSRWPDQAFYRWFVEQHGQPALDVGCATGRLVLDYLAEGLDVDGVDVSPEMLAICRRKAAARELAPRLYEQAIETLALPRRYRTIIAASSTLQLLLTPEAAAAGLRRLYEHLEPGGALVASFMLLEPAGDHVLREDGGHVLVQEWAKLRERVRPVDGAVVRRWSRTRYDRRTQLEETWDRYEVVRAGEVVASEAHARVPATRAYTQEQSAALFQSAGFAGVRLTKEFTTEPAMPEDRLWCVAGTRA